MPRYPAAQIPYGAWSAGAWPQQLYPAQYPPYPAWYYPQYGGAPVVGNYPPQFPVSPGRQKKERNRRHSLTPPPEIQLHHLLGGRYRPTTIWDVGQDPSTSQHMTKHGGVEKLPAPFLDEPATSPPVQKMRIVSDAFDWDINIAVPRGTVVTVRHIFGAIHGTLQNQLEKDEWDAEPPNSKRNMHRARCARLAKGPASYKVDMHIKRVDTLGERTYFMGLKPVGPVEDPEEWLLMLAPPPKPKQGRR
ncbi:hypothetical protein K439DRAFT_1630356 [Ramaria rubella]|nr:hypothetical protein K439DRAFT_1630356 [Ramaria rubella]